MKPHVRTCACACEPASGRVEGITCLRLGPGFDLRGVLTGRPMPRYAPPGDRALAPRQEALGAGCRIARTSVKVLVTLNLLHLVGDFHMGHIQ